MTDRLPRLHVGSGTTHGALTTFPVWIEAPSVARLNWRPEVFTVAEREGNAVVSELVVTNTAPGMSVLLEGDLLEGGWQNRMVAEARVFEPGQASVMPVRCVEHGRWHGNAEHASRGRKSAYSVRYQDGDRVADQGRVWRRIDRFESTLGRTQSASLIDHLDGNQAPRVARLQGQRGVMIGIGGRIIAAELFGSRTGFARRWDGIINAAWLDSMLAPAVATPAEAARDFARRLAELPIERTGVAGIATAVAGHRRGLQLTGIVGAGTAPGHQGPNPIHATVFDQSHPSLQLA